MDTRHLLAAAGIAAVKWQKRKKKTPAAASASRQEQIRTCARGEAELIWTPSAPVIARRLGVSRSGCQLLQPQAENRVREKRSPRRVRDRFSAARWNEGMREVTSRRPAHL